jgi:hypothetical protein
MTADSTTPTAAQEAYAAATAANSGQGTNSNQGTSVSQTTTPPITQYTDGSAYEVPRPFLTLNQAAAILGKSLRSLERSLLGRWGNKLPEGWVARKIRTERGEEWRILPPPGFRVKFTQSSSTEYDTTPSVDAEPVDFDPSEISGMTGSYPQFSPSGHSSTPAVRRKLWRPDRHTLEQPSIVIDRTEEVEYLLRELVTTQKALSEERRLHMDDLRMIHQLQGSMRLLEANTNEQARAKSELEATKQELQALKEQYNRMVKMPWWRRLFSAQPY